MSIVLCVEALAPTTAHRWVVFSLFQTISLHSPYTPYLWSSFGSFTLFCPCPVFSKPPVQHLDCAVKDFTTEKTLCAFKQTVICFYRQTVVQLDLSCTARSLDECAPCSTMLIFVTQNGSVRWCFVRLSFVTCWNTINPYLSSRRPTRRSVGIVPTWELKKRVSLLLTPVMQTVWL